MKHYQGFTIIEWMISMTLGLFLLGGVMSIYVVSQSSTHDAMDNTDLQENGRIAMNILIKDLHYVNFWGELTGISINAGNGISLSTSASSLTTANDCLDDQDVGSFPKDDNTLRSIWVTRTSSSGAISAGLDCLSSTLQTDSDILVLKHVEGKSVRNVGSDPSASVIALEGSADTANKRFFIAATPSSGYFFKGSESLPNNVGNQNPWIWTYAHHVYYIALNNGVPELYRRELTETMKTDNRGALVRGVERLRVLVALDTSQKQDGSADKYVLPSEVDDNQWNDGRVVGLKIFMLIRAESPDPSYTNQNQYILGDYTMDFQKEPDHYRRLLLQTTVNFNKTSTGS